MRQSLRHLDSQELSDLGKDLFLLRGRQRFVGILPFGRMGCSTEMLLWGGWHDIWR